MRLRLVAALLAGLFCASAVQADNSGIFMREFTQKWFVKAWLKKQLKRDDEIMFENAIWFRQARKNFKKLDPAIVALRSDEIVKRIVGTFRTGVNHGTAIQVLESLDEHFSRTYEGYEAYSKKKLGGKTMKDLLDGWQNQQDRVLNHIGEQLGFSVDDLMYEQGMIERIAELAKGQGEDDLKLGDATDLPEDMVALLEGQPSAETAALLNERGLSGDLFGNDPAAIRYEPYQEPYLEAAKETLLDLGATTNGSRTHDLILQALNRAEDFGQPIEDIEGLRAATMTAFGGKFSEAEDLLALEATLSTVDTGAQQIATPPPEGHGAALASGFQNSGSGHSRALQAGTLLSANCVQQTRHLQKLFALEAQLQAEFLGGETDREAAWQAYAEQLLRVREDTLVGDEEGDLWSF